MERRLMRAIRIGLIGVFALLLAAGPAAAQGSGGQNTAMLAAAATNRPITLAVAGGLNSASINLPVDLFLDVGIPELEFSTGRLVGFIGGVLADIPMAPDLAFETGGLLSVKGVTERLTFEGVGAKADVRMTYLDVPALIRYEVAPSASHTLSVLAGVTTGLRLSARVRVTADGMSETLTITSEVPTFDFGLTVGGRVDIGQGFGDVRYTHGLRNLASEPGPGGETVKHRVISFMAGWRF